MTDHDFTAPAFSDETRGKIVPSPIAKSPLDPSVNRDIVMRDPGLPEAQGLYDPANEHDACGVGFVANMHNAKSHDIVKMGLEILLNLDHRGATGADPKAGDGCGMLLQIPHDFFVAKAKENGFALPEAGHYAIGVLFLPKDPELRGHIEEIIDETSAAQGFALLGWRDVPVDPSVLGESVVPTEPMTRQLFIGRGPTHTDQDVFERRLYILRKSISQAIYSASATARPRRLLHRCRCRARTVVYKGMFLADQLGKYYR